MSEIEGGGNRELRTLLAEAQLSNAGLARAVVRAGADEGVHLGTGTTSVRRMLDGAQPRWPVPRLVATVLSRQLGYPVSVPDCGFTDHVPPRDTFDGFECAPSIGGTIRTVAELSGRDLNRRNFLLGSSFAASAFAQPAWFAVTTPTGEPLVPKTDGPRIGDADVQVFRQTVQHFASQHRRYGGGLVREQVVRFLNGYAQNALRGSYSESVGRALSSAVSEAAFLAGLTTVDSGRHALGQRYYAQALRLAMQAQDRGFAANVLAEMSALTVHIGQSRTGAADDGQHAAALARSALQVVGDTGGPSMSAWLHAVEARGLALLGDASATVRALDAARRAFDQREPDDEPRPPWLNYYGEADLLSDVGQCLRDVGRPRQGLALLEQAQRSLPAARVTSHAKTSLHVASAYLELGEFEQADTVTARALTAIGGLSSVRTLDRVRSLQHRVRACGSQAALRQLDQRITEFLLRGNTS